ncbi:hypothetical protein WJX74_004272 [Apatococcus lobatus]|uniref:C2 domain-containing protein n=1 Tax=Apatococcus lobatus TaxID=904363 RepID=A0AAW1RH99_9CHLO
MTSSSKALECGGHEDVRLQFKNIKVAALPNKGVFQREPYLTFEVEGGTKAQTLPAPNAVAPFWDEGVAILVPAHSTNNLVITVHNKHNILLPDTFVGSVSFRQVREVQLSKQVVQTRVLGRLQKPIRQPQQQAWVVEELPKSIVTSAQILAAELCPTLTDPALQTSAHQMASEGFDGL